ncbi:hypothetical protein AB0395_47050 [Streptosporangium sp. NPDC051023]|uniref:hypothetical protein n=1 Tax=Streptosporangium sp. NPDC051023 TaxID=3155410 RepID=UPI00344CCF81
MKPLTPERLAAIRERDDHSLDLATDPAQALNQAEADRSDLRAEVDRLRAIVDGDETFIVLERPDELGISWEDGDDLLALTKDGITLFPRGVDEWGLDLAQARELSAQLAEMADAYEAARGGAR